MLTIILNKLDIIVPEGGKVITNYAPFGQCFNNFFNCVISFY